jgi:hypothetical protein
MKKRYEKNRKKEGERERERGGGVSKESGREEDTGAALTVRGDLIRRTRALHLPFGAIS